MSKRNRRSGPSDPQAIMLKRARERAQEREDRKDPAKWGVDPSALSLPAQADVEGRLDQRGRVFHAYRSDVFDLLFGRKALSEAQHRAARRLEEDVAERAGLNGPEAGFQVIDCGSSPSWSRAAVTSGMVEAGRRVDEILSLSGPSSSKLLMELVVPMVQRGTIIAWRGVVERVTKESREEVQSAMVRRACDDLAEAYKTFDARPVRASA